MRPRFVLVSLLLAAIACSSGNQTSRPADIPRPEIDVAIPHTIWFASGAEAPADVNVTVTNRATRPIAIRRVEISSPGMTQYRIQPASREYRDEVGPGQTKTVTIYATAQTQVDRPTEPLMLRVLIEFESAGQRWREIVNQRGG
ncbi:MAG TPA: hypothetical protein VF824_15510 [Thermoanaerobaculia bacterium]|jgi:hypothetical protein